MSNDENKNENISDDEILNRLRETVSKFGGEDKTESEKDTGEEILQSYMKQLPLEEKPAEKNEEPKVTEEINTVQTDIFDIAEEVTPETETPEEEPELEFIADEPAPVEEPGDEPVAEEKAEAPANDKQVPKKSVYKFRRNKVEEKPAPAVAEQVQTYHIDESGKASIADMPTSELPITKYSDLEKADEPIIDTVKDIKAPGIDKPDVDMMIALGINPDKVRELYGDEVADKYSNEMGVSPLEYAEETGFEYTEQAQAEEIMDDYRRENKSATIKLFSALAISVLLLILENLHILGGGALAAFGRLDYPLVYIMAGLQLFLITAAIAYKSIYNGALNLFRMTPSPESVTFVIALITLIYDIIIAFGAKSAPNLYNFPASLCILLTMLYEYFNIRRETFGFNITASKKTKFIAKTLTTEEASKEYDAFREYIDEAEPKIIRVEKTNFVNNFFTRNEQHSVTTIDKVLIPVVLAAMVLCFIASMVRQGTPALSLAIANITVLLCTPLTVFFSSGYPLYKASREAFENRSAVIGEGAVSEYSGTSVITLEDKEVFPSYLVKIKSVKVFGSNVIDRVLYDATSLFSKVGGPLADVLELATIEIGKATDVTLVGTEDDGVEVLVEGQTILAGKAEYLERHGIIPQFDDADRAITAKEEISIMYIAKNGELAAKFYIQYLIDADFEIMLKHLGRAGFCTAIRTFDPNINAKLLANRVKSNKYAVKIIKCDVGETLGEISESADSGIISTGGSKAVVGTIAATDRLSGAIKTNQIVKILAVVISVLLCGVLSFISSNGDMPSLYVALYQLFWILPSLIVSKLYI